MRTFRIQLPLGITLVLMTSGLLQAQAPSEESVALPEWQNRIEAADDEIVERLLELRRLEAETRRLEARSDTLASRLERRRERLDRRETALDTLANTRDVLPDIEHALTSGLRAWIEQDLPFLREERLARAERLEAGRRDPDASMADRLDRLLASWRTELEYGRELDAWRGILKEGDARREVDFLRLGRVGLYYLTPDRREGAVWRADERRWVTLDDAERLAVRQGLRIARDQRAPELLTLPISRPLERSVTTANAEAGS